MDAKIIAGDALGWTESQNDYPASEGWILTYKLVSPIANISFSATASGDDFVVAVSSAVTALWVAGHYRWQGYVEKAGSRYTIGDGWVDIEPNLGSVITGGQDTRSHARKVLEAIEAVIEKRATKDQESYSIAGRALSRTSLEQLREHRTFYRTEVRAEERLASGHQGPRFLVRL